MASLTMARAERKRSQPPVSQSHRCVDARFAALRNRYILNHADSLFLGALDPNGSALRFFVT